jgi:hypothetical protein
VSPAWRIRWISTCRLRRLFDGKHQPRHGAAIADADAPDGVQIAHEAALIDRDTVQRRASGVFVA